MNLKTYEALYNAKHLFGLMLDTGLSDDEWPGVSDMIAEIDEILTEVDQEGGPKDVVGSDD